jgi:uncharacterized peroxidase-related enzyme
MSHFNIPATIADAPAASQAMLEAVNKQFGLVPNLFRLVANSPQALEGYLALSAALGRGSLPAQTRERIALAVAEINRCAYCLSAHSYLGKNLAKLDDAEILANRRGTSTDPKADAAVRFAAQVALNAAMSGATHCRRSRPPAMTRRRSSKSCSTLRSTAGPTTSTL